MTQASAGQHCHFRPLQHSSLAAGAGPLKGVGGEWNASEMLSRNGKDEAVAAGEQRGDVDGNRLPRRGYPQYPRKLRSEGAVSGRFRSPGMHGN